METQSVTLTRSPYEILQVSHWSDTEEIKAKYFHLVKQYNPEYYPDEFIEIRTAFDILKNPSTRAQTDVRQFIQPPKFHYSDYPDYQNQTLSLFKLNQELKALTGEFGSVEDLQSQDQEKAIHILHGIALYHIIHENFDEAQNTWKRILSIKPNDQESQENMALAVWHEGYHAAKAERYDRAEQLFQSLIDQEINHGQIYQNLALAQEKQGKKEEAEESWNKALSAYKKELNQDPNDEYLKAIVLAVHKYTGGKFLDEAGTQSYAKSGSAKELGYACIQKGNWRQAVDALQQAYRENPDDLDVLCQLGWAYLNTNTHTKAFQMWNTALKKAPGKKSIVDHLVRGYIIFGKRLKEQRIYNQALVQFKNALKHDPNNSDLRMLLADTYLNMKNYSAAMNEYQKVLELDPRNKQARQGVRESKRLGGIR